MASLSSHVLPLLHRQALMQANVSLLRPHLLGCRHIHLGARTNTSTSVLPTPTAHHHHRRYSSSSSASSSSSSTSSSVFSSKSGRVAIAGILGVATAAGALELYKHFYGPTDGLTATARSLVLKSKLAQNAGDPQRALSLLQDAEKLTNAEAVGYPYITDTLANLHLLLHNLDDAERYFRITMRARIARGVPPTSDEMIEISIKLATIYEMQSKPELAEVGYHWAAATMGAQREHLAEEVLRQQRREAYQQAHQADAKLDDNRTAMTPSPSSSSSSSPPPPPPATKATKAVHTRWGIDGPDADMSLENFNYPLLAMALEHLGRFYAQNGVNEPALELLQESLRIVRRKMGPNHEQVGAILATITTVQHELRDDVAAKRTALAALEFARQPAGRRMLHVALFNLATVQLALEGLSPAIVAMLIEADNAAPNDYERTTLRGSIFPMLKQHPTLRGQLPWLQRPPTN
ncbi:hypothetical protein CAOG_08054 [Capsaspora owczarzaki ATCC 30864]|nr:hypothetical protein CAOG_08054 [Capsaspora owczarzaki ATCC 30864]|eukprot:XP_004342655.2 hypothetical protein CAOG_08054 [Capsaspora owczarzaki ATCC 30864]